jgi:hypothetical protein
MAAGPALSIAKLAQIPTAKRPDAGFDIGIEPASGSLTG